jgi:hypothetical protein
MPSLIRLLFAIGLLGGLGYAGVLALGTLVEPQKREITVTVPQERLNRHK